MATNVNLSSSIRTNLLALQSTNKLFDRTSERLSTGLKINSALDGASSFFAARNLNNRASDFTGLKDGIGQGIQTLKTADKGLEALTKLVEQAKSLADQAKEASSQISLRTGTTDGLSSATAATVMTAAFTGLTAAHSTGSFTIAVNNGAAVTITLDGDKSIQHLLTQLNNVDSGLTATFNTATDKLELTATAGAEVTIAADTAGAGAYLFGASFVGTTVFGSTGSGSSVSSLENDFEKVMAEINALVLDTSYKGINLLNGNNLTVNVNETSATLTITGSTLNVTGLGFTAATVNFGTSGNIDTSITEAKAALTKLRDTAAGFSTDLSLLQARDSFTTDLINQLEQGAGLLVDANLEKESANLLALQTRQALGTSSLSFASQSQQSVLQLFR